MSTIKKGSDFYHAGRVYTAKDKRRLKTGAVVFVDEFGEFHPEDECISLLEACQNSSGSGFEVGDMFIHNGQSYVATYVFPEWEDGVGILVDHRYHIAHPIHECEHYYPDLDESDINTVLAMAACCTWEDIELFEAMPKNQWQQVWDRMPQSSRKRVHEQKRIRDKHQASQPVEAEAC